MWSYRARICTSDFLANRKRYSDGPLWGGKSHKNELETVRIADLNPVLQPPSQAKNAALLWNSLWMHHCYIDDYSFLSSGVKNWQIITWVRCSIRQIGLSEFNKLCSLSFNTEKICGYLRVISNTVRENPTIFFLKRNWHFCEGINFRGKTGIDCIDYTFCCLCLSLPVQSAQFLECSYLH
jgi:hypothetical protein